LRCGAGAKPPCWKLDRKESTKLSLKYRRGKGEILIISHAGRGWWDPTSDAKGDVFRLVQRLEPGLSFGHVRKRLRAFAGLSPGFPSGDRMLLPLVIRRRPEPSEVILAGERNRHTARQTRLSPGVGSLAAASRPPHSIRGLVQEIRRTRHSGIPPWAPSECNPVWDRASCAESVRPYRQRCCRRTLVARCAR
jgi:hypothetical protein